jgi:hypothetical protein
MRNKPVLGLLFLLLVVLLLVGLYVHQHNKLQSAWESVAQAAVRLESSIQYEPVIVLRTKMAELDAALKHYKSVKESSLAGRLEKQNDGGVKAMELALRHLSLGLEEQSQEQIRIFEENWSSFDVDSFPTEDLQRLCAEGKLYVLSSDLARAHTLAALRILSILRGAETSVTVKFDREKADTACAEDKKERLANAKIKAEQAKASEERERARAEVRAAEARRAQSLTKCDYFEKHVKPGSSNLSADEIAKYLQKCADIRSGKLHDIGQH